MKITILASGSSGNSTFIKTNTHNLLIDVGISPKKITELLKEKSESISQIDMIFITHEHIDHIMGLATILKKQDIKLFISKGTLLSIFESNNYNLIKILKEYQDKKLIYILNKIDKTGFYEKIICEDGLSIEPIPIFHDAFEPVGFIFTEESKKITLITDTGYVHNALYEKIANSDCYVLEFNHDPEILMNCARPYALKMRILSDHGHLSNEDAAVTLAKVIGENTKKVFYSHISEECNLTEIIKLTKKKVFKDIGVDDSYIEYIVTSRVCSKVYEI